VTKEVVGVGVEGNDVMPGSLGRRTDAVRTRGRGRIIRRRDAIGNEFLVIFGDTNLWVSAETANEDELGHVGRTRRGDGECASEAALGTGLAEEGEHDGRGC